MQDCSKKDFYPDTVGFEWFTFTLITHTIYV